MLFLSLKNKQINIFFKVLKKRIRRGEFDDMGDNNEKGMNLGERQISPRGLQGEGTGGQ